MTDNRPLSPRPALAAAATGVGVAAVGGDVAGSIVTKLGQRVL
jgi:hypothetical protein